MYYTLAASSNHVLNNIAFAINAKRYFFIVYYLLPEVALSFLIWRGNSNVVKQTLRLAFFTLLF